jgi:formate hydrogenlyase transcriptional activator
VTGSSVDTSGLFQPAMEASPTAVLIADAAGTIVLVNRELERQFGYAREELLGHSVDRLLPESLRSLHAAHRTKFAHTPEARRMGAGGALFGVRKDGSQFAVEVGLNPMRTGDALFVLASIVDITERRRLEDAHRAALEEQLDFERFVAELSFQFINLPDGEVADAIRNGLGRMCRLIGADRGTFYRIDPESVFVDPISWTAPGVPPLQADVPAKTVFPWAIQRVLAGEVIAFSTLADIPADIDRASYHATGTKSSLMVPLSVDAQVIGTLGFDTVLGERTWSPEVRHRLTVMGGVFLQVLARQRRDEAVRAAAREVQRLKDQLQVENVYLRREERERLGLTRVVGQSTAVQRVLNQIQQVALTDSTVLLLGETGTGKELFATQIHELSARHGRTMVRVNCAAIPPTLIESELFGREKGAFTGALARQEGRFELAHHSTIFLDEIGDLPPDVQVKLLRVLEERTIERLGSPRPIAVDTRIIAATHRNLEQRVAEGTFREDLYYRLNVFPIHVPPLRERVEDIPLLVWRFIEEFSKAFAKRIDSIDRDTLSGLQHYTWPGNIRELRNVVERAMIVSTSRRLTIAAPRSSAAAGRRSAKLADIEKEHIRGVLESTRWRIRGTGGAADRLGLKPTTLETRMAKLGLTRPGHAQSAQHRLP